MRLAIALLIILAFGGLSTNEGPLRPTKILSNFDEVYASREFDGQTWLATSSGVKCLETGRVSRIVGSMLPGRIRGFDISEGLLVAYDDQLNQAFLQEGEWQKSSERHSKQTMLDIAPPDGSGGAFLSTQTVYGGNTLYSFWGASKLYSKKDGRWQPSLARPPTPGDYCLFQAKGVLFAGTPQGLWKLSDRTWTRVKLGSRLPITRVHGMACLPNGNKLIGGTEGLWLQSGVSWSQISREPVRAIVKQDKYAWVLFGNGALDKFDVQRNLRHSDILYGAVRRPWCSAISMEKGNVLLGGTGGWFVRTASGQKETYAKELDGDVVTCLVAYQGGAAIGTQRGGLFLAKNGKLKRIGPASGLSDPWVTGLTLMKKDLYISTATKGLFRLSGDRVAAVECPNQSIQNLAKWRECLVIGTAQGCWRKEPEQWVELDIDKQETCGFSFDGSALWVLTPTGTYLFKD